MPNSIPNKTWTHILVDFITMLLLAQGYGSILVVVDRYGVFYAYNQKDYS